MKILTGLKALATNKLLGVTLVGVVVAVPVYFFAVGGGARPAAPDRRIAASPTPDRRCGGVFLAQDMAGAWRVRSGNAHVGGTPMVGGSDDLKFDARGNDLLLSIPGGPPVTLVPLAGGAPQWDWTKSEGRPLDPPALKRALDCDFDAVTRYQGSVSFASDGDGTASAATFRLAILSRDHALLLWELTAPTQGQGYFQIERR